MGVRLLQAVEWLFVSPWRLVFLVALVALPMLVMSELSSRDQREQIRSSQARQAAFAADRAAGTFADQLFAVRNGLVQLLGSSITAGPLAPQVGVDADRVQEQLLVVWFTLGDEVSGLYALDRERLIYAAQLPAGAQVSSADLVALRGKPFPHPERLVAITSPSNSRISEAYRETGDRLLTTVSARAGTWPTLAAEIDLGRVAERIAALLPPGEVYLVDKEGALVMPLSTGRRVRTVPAGSRLVSAGSSDDNSPYAAVVPDPIDGRAALTAVARVPETDWRIVMVQPPTLASQIDPVLDQVSAIRILLVAVMLMGALAVALSGAQAIRQRRALALANAELERASQEKSRFLAGMSHEIRTPLNAIIGFSQLLEERVAGELSPKQFEYVHDVAESGKHLLTLVNDILDLSKVEAGKMHFRPEPFVVVDVVRRMQALVAPLADQNGVRLVMDAEDELPDVRHDAARFRQVLYNLLSNAVKFTPEGGSVTTTVRSDEDGWIELRVSDTGIGMSDEDQATIFEEFKRLDSSYARAQPGTGLGLALVKRFVERMGGEISVTSEIGKGSTFSVRLPNAMPASAAD